MTIIKKSYGIICTRYIQNIGLQIILIKKPLTYYFCEFMSGKYYHDYNTLLFLFNNMTYHEKMDILSMNFETLWYRLHKNEHNSRYPIKGTYYIKQKSKFEMFTNVDRGELLKKLLVNTTNSETIWEIPKGRKDESKNELEINTALREFYEETLITEDKFEILFNIKPYIETYTDFGVTYQNIYYYAKSINNDWEPKVIFSNGKQIAEVADIKWCSLNDIKNIRLDKFTYNRLIKLFKKVKLVYSNNNRIIGVKFNNKIENGLNNKIEKVENKNEKVENKNVFSDKKKLFQTYGK